MALADRKEGDAAELQKVHDFNDQLEAHVTDKLAEAYELTEELIKDNPRVGNVLNRFCLCDSRGQHKLPREKKRLGIEDTKAVEVKPTPRNEEKNDYSIF